MAYAREELGLKRVAAITDTRNESSIRLLEKIGFKYEGMIRLSDDDPEIKLFVSEL